VRSSDSHQVQLSKMVTEVYNRLISQAVRVQRDEFFELGRTQAVELTKYLEKKGPEPVPLALSELMRTKFGDPKKRRKWGIF
jgi:hypothetical protein